ncbi:MAG: GreA/GreB family elongation factor, partial [Bryobacterales bacterium]|nr:GreA/GreB family elongation factor [Bryobacterales bacterium]
SYQSPVAQSLLNHKIGDQVEFEIHGVRHHHRIEAIEALKPAAAGETVAATADNASTEAVVSTAGESAAANPSAPAQPEAVPASQPPKPATNHEVPPGTKEVSPAL